MRGQYKYILYSETLEVYYVYPAALNQSKIKKNNEISIVNKQRK